jgi:endonuclease YncB( thermonuclease family)
LTLAITLRAAPLAMAVLAGCAVQGVKVLSIGDGDTLRVQDHGRPVIIRLACIDPPATASGIGSTRPPAFRSALVMEPLPEAPA